ncbi:aminotransferase class IV [Caminibacter sp.]
MEFIETLLIKNAQIQNFKYHLSRVQKSYNYFKWKFNLKEWEELRKKHWEKETSRLRITYSAYGIKLIETFPLKKREFKKFKIVKINFDYSFKYKNRKHFEKIHNQYRGYDEFILVKNGFITDTTISNLAFFTGKEWVTPKYPLLKGTKREELLKKGFLKEEIIKLSDLRFFKKFAMINAILDFEEKEMSCIKF